MFEEITGMLVKSLDVVFAPLAVFSPATSLFIVSAFITVLVMVLTRLTTNKKAMKEIKEKMQSIREQMTAAQKIGDTTGANKFLAEMMSTNNDYMKQMYKGLFVSLIVISLFLPWLNYTYEAKTVASLPFDVPFIGRELSWILWYVLVSFTIGWVIRKIFGFD